MYERMKKQKRLFNSNKRIMLAHMIEHTNENQGTTIYDLSCRLFLSPGNVYQHINGLLKQKKIEKIEIGSNEKDKVPYYMPEEIKKDFIEKYPFLKIDMYSEVDFVREKLIGLNAIIYFEDEPVHYPSTALIAADANDYLKYLADCKYGSFTVYWSDKGILKYNGGVATLEDYYGLTFYAIKHSICTKFLFEFVERDTDIFSGLKFETVSDLFSGITRYAFSENGTALMERSDDIIDRMFRQTSFDATFEFPL